MLSFLTTLMFVAASKPDAAIGIDLGTTFSCVSILKKGETRPTFLQFENGLFTYPSVVLHNKIDGKTLWLTGHEANNHHVNNPSTNYYFGFKRCVGVSSLDEITRLDDFKKSVTFPIRRAFQDGKHKLEFLVLDDRKNEIEVTDAEHLSSYVLRDLKTEIEKYYNIVSLAITHPAYFSPLQVENTKRAAALAGLPEPVMGKEPVAAAVAYQAMENLKFENSSEGIMVFDLGGGTFDVSVVETDGNSLYVNKHGGNNFLGGENVNDNLTNYFASQIKSKFGFDVKNDQTTLLRLRKFVEDFKIKLCTQYSKDKSANEHKDTFIFKDADSIEFSMTMSKFDELNKKFYNEIEKVLIDPDYGMFRKENERSKGHDEPLEKESITKILLVGGSSRIPYIKTLLRKIFPSDGNKTVALYDSLDADTIVAEGACLLAAGEVDMLPEDLAIEVSDSVPLSIGVCTDRNEFTAILLKDSRIPGKGEKEFTTSYDNQEKVMIQVAIGERYLFSDNQFLGKFVLDVQPNQPKGMPRISIEIAMTTDGTIEVKAIDKNTNKEAGIRFDSVVSRMDKEKYQEILRDAEKHKEADAELKAKFDKLKEFEFTIEMTKNRISVSGVSEEDKIDVEGLINGANKWLNDNKNTASKADIEDRLTSFNEAVTGILDKKAETQPEVEKTEPEVTHHEDKEQGREEL
ncbi:heat shock protein 70 [Vairimorpha apis BRL 01]|uniref:Heat shock protein 70 n=1 Tax=Vairimorpha apis BRL 01 TaxID=1037528 RepID=T0L570_9MICR|nr:heat shock protein 70 [Vairimorpha apis BRL 01]